MSRIARLIEKTFEKSPWYGPSMMDVLNEISIDQSKLRVGQSHSIMELVSHMISWRIFVTCRLTGDNDFELSEEANFATTGEWKEILGRLKKSQAELVAAAQAFPDERLSELVPSKSHKFTFYTLLHGIVQHDIYHIGQVQLIRKSASAI